MIPCAITKKGGSAIAYYPIFGRYIIDYPKPANPRHLTGSVSEMMDADSFSFVKQDITWDLIANF
jgi:hypothetical protein